MKKYLVLLMMSIMAMVLVACGGSGDKGSVVADGEFLSVIYLDSQFDGSEEIGMSEASISLDLENQIEDEVTVEITDIALNGEPLAVDDFAENFAGHDSMEHTIYLMDDYASLSELEGELTFTVFVRNPYLTHDALEELHVSFEL